MLCTVVTEKPESQRRTHKLVLVLQMFCTILFNYTFCLMTACKNKGSGVNFNQLTQVKMCCNVMH